MKRLFRKNQIIITALAIMIVIAGYLNFTADQTKPVKKEAESQTAEKLQAENIQAEEAAADAEADITSFPDEDLASVSAQAETVTDTETPEGEKVGEAVLTSSASAGAFSASAKLNREQVRSRNEASLLEIINNTEISEDMKADAIASINQLTDRAEKELDAEILLDAKGFLIKRALHIDDLRFELNEDSISFSWFSELPEPDEVHAYSTLIAALCKMSKDQKRISATEKPVENERYAFRCFLLRLGFIGNEYKTDRKILLRYLPGNSAFKGGEGHAISK